MDIVIHVEGMTCSHCEKKIVNTLLLIEGISNVKASSSRNQVTLNYDDSYIDLVVILRAVEALGYTVVDRKKNLYILKIITITLLLVTAFVVLKYSNSISYDFLPNIRQNMGYGALFIFGLLTSVHCLAMCGGINISQCAKYKENGNSVPSLLYNLGRITSYTITGGAIGGVGTVLSFSGQTRGYVTIAVSTIMLLMAVRMLKIFHVKRLEVQLPKSIQRIMIRLLSKGPFIVGLVNGFMPCGPLQSIQLYALGTGSIIKGALSMFYFSIGTFPLMFGLGFVSTLLNHRYSKNILRYSGLLIFILALNMFSRGAALAGIILPFQSNATVIESTIVNEDLQRVRIDLGSNSYKPIQVIKGIPVSFIINAEAGSINGCNNPLTIPSMNIEKTLIPGENEILFIPDDTGKITYTCWMGMITSYIEVIED